MVTKKIRKEGSMEDKKKKTADLDEELDEEESVETEDSLEEDEEEVETSKKSEDKKKSSKKDEDEDELLEEESEGSFGGKIVIALIVVAIIVVLLLKACTGKEQFNVTFDLNGGTGNFDTTIKVDENGKITKPADPTKEGYIFEGWYLNDQPFDFNTKVTADMKLEARWKLANTAKVTGVTISQESITIAIGGKATLVATVAPEDAADKSLTWTSSDPSVVTVDANGNIVGIKEGKATITVKTTDGGYEAECSVTVSKGVVAVTGVTFDKASVTVATGYTASLKAIISPSDATNKGLTWKSSDTSIATVNSKGVVTGKKEGTVTVTVTTSDGGYTATITVTVKNQAVTGVSISGDSSVTVGKTIKLKANIKPSNATNKNVTWKVTNGTGQATIDKNGNLKGVKAGKVTVTVTTADGKKTASKTITVKEAPSSYVLTLTAKRQAGTGAVMQYSWAITNNGKNVSTSDFTEFSYHGKTYKNNFGLLASRNVVKTDTKATIKLSNGKTVNATVKIKE